MVLAPPPHMSLSPLSQLSRPDAAAPADILRQPPASDSSDISLALGFLPIFHTMIPKDTKRVRETQGGITVGVGGGGDTKTNLTC